MRYFFRGGAPRALFVGIGTMSNSAHLPSNTHPKHPGLTLRPLFPSPSASGATHDGEVMVERDERDRPRVPSSTTPPLEALHISLASKPAWNMARVHPITARSDGSASSLTLRTGAFTTPVATRFGASGRGVPSTPFFTPSSLATPSFLGTVVSYAARPRVLPAKAGVSAGVGTHPAFTPLDAPLAPSQGEPSQGPHSPGSVRTSPLPLEAPNAPPGGYETIDTLTMDNAALQTNIAALQTNIAALQREKTRLLDVEAKLTREEEIAKNQAKESREYVLALTEDIAALQSRIAALRRENEILSEEEAKLTEAEEIAMNQRSESRNHVSALTAENLALSASLAALLSEKTRLEDDLTAAHVREGQPVAAPAQVNATSPGLTAPASGPPQDATTSAPAAPPLPSHDCPDEVEAVLKAFVNFLTTRVAALGGEGAAYALTIATLRAQVTSLSAKVSTLEHRLAVSPGTDSSVVLNALSSFVGHLSKQAVPPPPGLHSPRRSAPNPASRIGEAERINGGTPGVATSPHRVIAVFAPGRTSTQAVQAQWPDGAVMPLRPGVFFVALASPEEALAATRLDKVKISDSFVTIQMATNAKHVAAALSKARHKVQLPTPGHLTSVGNSAHGSDAGRRKSGSPRGATRPPPPPPSSTSPNTAPPPPKPLETLHLQRTR